MEFQFIAPDIIVKRGYIAQIGALCAKHMKKACIFRYGEHFFSSGIYDRVKQSLEQNGVEYAVFSHITGEPGPELIEAAANFMREHGCDGGLAIGGGSVIDAAKVTCALAPNSGGLMDYVEGFSPKPFSAAPYPVVAVPTTAGTGSECTKNSVITAKGQFKNSVRDDRMLPVAAIIDAELMLEVPQSVTATAGADCVCQLVECYTTRFANPLCDSIAIGFLPRAIEALPRAFGQGDDIDAREIMGISACACGAAMTNSGLGAAHGLAAGLGALTPLSHGFICGVVTPYVMRFNIKKGISKYANIARAVTHTNYATEETAALDAVRIVEELYQFIGIPGSFRGCGITEQNIPAIAKASMGSSMSKNAVDVSVEECEELLYSML